MRVTVYILVRPRRETSMLSVSCLGRTDTDSIKKHADTRYIELVFLHPVGSAVDVVHFGASGAQNVNTLFFVLVLALCGFDKKCARTRYVEHTFLHPVGSAGHVVHSGASGAQNVDVGAHKISISCSNM
jgi:hypothetical protein